MPRSGSTAQRGYGAAHQSRVNDLFTGLVEGAPCPYPDCGRPMHRDAARNFDRAKLEGDHFGSTARAYGGDTLPTTLAHRRCNRRAGARLGNKLRRASRGGHDPRGARRWGMGTPSRAW